MQESIKVFGVVWECVTYKSQVLGVVLIDLLFLTSSADSSCRTPLSNSLDHSMYLSWAAADPAKRLRIVHEIRLSLHCNGNLGGSQSCGCWPSYQSSEIALANAGLTRQFHCCAFPLPNGALDKDDRELSIRWSLDTVRLDGSWTVNWGLGTLLTLS